MSMRLSRFLQQLRESRHILDGQTVLENPSAQELLGFLVKIPYTMARGYLSDQGDHFWWPGNRWIHENGVEMLKSNGYLPKEAHDWRNGMRLSMALDRWNLEREQRASQVGPVWIEILCPQEYPANFHAGLKNFAPQVKLDWASEKSPSFASMIRSMQRAQLPAPRWTPEDEKLLAQLKA